MKFRQLISFYEHLIIKYPKRTKSITAAVVYCSGDIIAQQIENSNINKPKNVNVESKTFNYLRSFSMFTTGIVDGFICHYWFNFIDTVPQLLKKHLANKKPSEMKIMSTKILFDQVLFAPPELMYFFLIYGITFGLMNKLFDKDDDDMMLEDNNKVKTNNNSNNNKTFYTICNQTFNHTTAVFVPTFLNSCYFWPPIQLINFKYVPLRYQVLFMNMAAVNFNIYLSYVANKKIEKN
jgi:protein Mpv17